MHQDVEGEMGRQGIGIGDWVEVVSPTKWDGCEGIVENIHNTGFGPENYKVRVQIETEGSRGKKPVFYLSELKVRGV